jgi:ADP-dependent phosphofructokinase/glucokinase
LAEFDTPVHVEYVTTDEKRSESIKNHILPEADSIGMDEYELKELSSIEGPGDVDLGEAYQASKEMIEEHNLSRVHIHTINYHLVVVEEDYEIKSEKIRDSMLFGEVCAMQLAENGHIPNKTDIENFGMENKYLKKLDHLEDFADYFDLDNFVETGFAKIEDYRVIAIPIIIHEDAERLVGMGDVISSAAFTSELK